MNGELFLHLPPVDGDRVVVITDGSVVVAVGRLVVVRLVVVVARVVVGAAVGLEVELMSGVFPSLQKVTTQPGAAEICEDFTTIAI